MRTIRATSRLTALVSDLLQLDNVERLAASGHVRTWKQQQDQAARAAAGKRR